MLRLKLFVVIAVLFSFIFTVNAQTDKPPKELKVKGDYLHKSTKTIFPEKLYDYQMNNILSFDKKNTNIGVTYTNAYEPTAISIYLYPAPAAYEGRLRNEFYSSLQSLIYLSGDTLYDTKHEIVKYVGEKYTCNGIRSQTKFSNSNGLTQLTLYECGRWILKIRISSEWLNGKEMLALEQKIVQTFDPSKLTALAPLNTQAKLLFLEMIHIDSTLLGGTIDAALAKIKWSEENVNINERASGFPDMYLDMHVEALKAFSKYDKEHFYMRHEYTIRYLNELNLLIASGFLKEFIVQEYGMIMVIPENTILNFEGFNKWKQNNKLSKIVTKSLYKISYN